MIGILLRVFRGSPYSSLENSVFPLELSFRESTLCVLSLVGSIFDFSFSSQPTAHTWYVLLQGSEKWLCFVWKILKDVDSLAWCIGVFIPPSLDLHTVPSLGSFQHISLPVVIISIATTPGPRQLIKKKKFSLGLTVSGVKNLVGSMAGGRQEWRWSSSWELPPWDTAIRQKETLGMF